MPVVAVTGSPSGIGAATTALLREHSHDVIGVDLAEAEARADLGTAAGRASAVGAVRAACDGRLPIAEACPAGDEANAITVAEEQLSLFAYPAAKAAIARWVRSHAHTADWAGTGIRTNVIAPGLIDTPLTDKQLDDPLIGDALLRTRDWPALWNLEAA